MGLSFVYWSWCMDRPTRIQVVDGTAAGVSPYPGDEPSLTFMMEGATIEDKHYYCRCFW